MGFSLATEPWIAVLTDAGMTTSGLINAFAADVITVACGDDLENTAVTRLLLAVQIAADAANVSPTDWLDAHQDRFDLFDEDRPFWQNPDMVRFTGLTGTVHPIITASYRYTGSRSTAVNLWHSTSGITYTPAAAARLLVARQQFSVGGRQPFTAAAYGKAPMSAKASVGTNRPLLWLDTGRLSDSLRATAALAAEWPTGTFWFSWPQAYTPAEYGDPTGVLDALTWPSRSILLCDHSPAAVAGIMICDGLRWPEPDTNNPRRDQTLVPHTVYARKKGADAYAAQDVHPDRPIWRQLATMCADPDNPAAPWQSLAVELGGRWRLGGLGSYLSAIFGPLTGAFPAPQDTAALAAFLADVTATNRRIASAVGSLNRAISDHDGYGPVIAAIAGPTGLSAQAASLAEQLATGQIALEQAQSALAGAAEEMLSRAYATVTRVRPLAAGRIAARKSNTTENVKTSRTPKSEEPAYDC